MGPIGRIVKYDEENNYGPWRKYMRVWVKIDMEEPLKQDLVIEREEGDDIKLIFKFENLSKLCFICGSIGQTKKNCNKKI
jgi:hypothetical protein